MDTSSRGIPKGGVPLNQPEKDTILQNTTQVASWGTLRAPKVFHTAPGIGDVCSVGMGTTPSVILDSMVPHLLFYG